MLISREYMRKPCLLASETKRQEETSPPQFTTQLNTSETCKEGEAFELACVVDGTPVPVVQWFKDNVAVDDVPHFVTSCDDGVCTLRMHKITLEDQGLYTCRASNTLGVAETSVSVSVQGE